MLRSAHCLETRSMTESAVGAEGEIKTNLYQTPNIFSALKKSFIFPSFKLQIPDSIKT
jgi:hypothetical protein